MTFLMTPQLIAICASLFCINAPLNVHIARTYDAGDHQPVGAAYYVRRARVSPGQIYRIRANMVLHAGYVASGKGKVPHWHMISAHVIGRGLLRPIEVTDGLWPVDDDGFTRLGPVTPEIVFTVANTTGAPVRVDFRVGFNVTEQLFQPGNESLILAPSFTVEDLYLEPYRYDKRHLH